MKALEAAVERIIPGSCWILAVFVVGLAVALAVHDLSTRSWPGIDRSRISALYRAKPALAT